MFSRNRLAEINKSKTCQSIMNVLPGILLIIIGVVNIWSIRKSLKEIKKINPNVCDEETYCKTYDGIIMVNLLLMFGVLLDVTIEKSSKVCTICSGSFWIMTYGVILIVNSAKMLNGSDGIMVGALWIEAKTISEMFSLEKKMLSYVALILNMVQWTLVLIIVTIKLVDFLLDRKRSKLLRRQVLPTNYENRSNVQRYSRTIRDLHEHHPRVYDMASYQIMSSPRNNERQVVYASVPPNYHDLFNGHH